MTVENKTKSHILIIGGGAAGIMAAIAAGRLGADVTILERNPRIGKKLLATGNGRCNFTNTTADVSCYHGSDSLFASTALSRFSPEDAVRFFEDLGIAHKVEEQGKVFPMSDQASSILDVLMYELKELGIRVICDAKVSQIRPDKGRFIINLENGDAVQGDRVILAAGGKAMPSSGSDGSGYPLARALGHSVTGLFPALVQLMLEGPFFKRIDGIKFVGTAEILTQNKPIAKERGDILFTNYGVSGPPILQISRKAGELLQQRKEAVLKLSVLDTMTQDDVRRLISERIQKAPKKPVDFSFVGLINKRLIPVLLAEVGVGDLRRLSGSLSSQERERIASLLTDWRFNIRGTMGWANAQVTAGGINTGEIDPDTMESRLIPGLYFAGEIMDIDGLCGGYNLQWAWSSGMVAGRNAASQKELKAE